MDWLGLYAAIMLSGSAMAWLGLYPAIWLVGLQWTSQGHIQL